MVNAFPFETAPRFLLRDRDGLYGKEFQRRVASLGMEEELIAPRSPWQNPYVERLIGTLRRECLDHVIVMNEQHLRRVIRDYLEYYHHDRTHRSLDQDCLVPRPFETIEEGKIYEFPKVGGLHTDTCVGLPESRVTCQPRAKFVLSNEAEPSGRFR